MSTALLVAKAFGVPYTLIASLTDAPDDVIRAGLWEFEPFERLAVLHERRVRWGVPSPDDFDPEYH